MTQIRRAIIAVSAATALAGTGLTLATDATAAPPPASWDCTAVKGKSPKTYWVYCLHIPKGHKVRVVLNCKIFPTGKTAVYLGPWVGNVAISEVSPSDCLSRDGYVTTFGPRAG